MWETIIPAAASIIGGLLSKRGQDNANEANVALTDENRQWMEKMSSTSYQRGVKDMEAAGLNPMLAYSQGGASTPTSAAPVVQNSLGAGVSGFANSAQSVVGMMQGVQQVQQSKAQEDNLRAGADKIRSETMERDMNTAALAARISQTNASSDQAKAVAAKTLEEVLGARYTSQSAQMAYRANKGDDELKGTGWAADVARRKAEASLANLEIPRAQNEAGFETTGMGQMNPYLRQVLQIFRGAASARGALSFGK